MEETTCFASKLRPKLSLSSKITIIYSSKKQGHFDEKYADFEIILKFNNTNKSPCPNIFPKRKRALLNMLFLLF